MAIFDKTYHPPGTAPGTLVQSAELASEKPKIYLIDYDGQNLLEKHLESVEECQSYMEKESVSWIHLQGSFQPATIKNLGKLFELHPLALEDALDRLPPGPGPARARTIRSGRGAVR